MAREGTRATGRRAPLMGVGARAAPTPPNVLQGTPDDANAGDRWLRACLVALAAVLGLQQIQDDRLWWDLARGRAVLTGAVAPSRALSAGDPGAEADWLGGAAWHVVEQYGGVAGLMLVRLAGIAFVLWMCTWRSVDRWQEAAATGAALVAVAPALDPTGGWWDVVLGWLAIMRGTRLPAAAGGPLAIGALAAAWANLGPRSLLVLGAAGRHGRWGVAAACVGLCLTPRGVFGVLDSARILAPPASVAWFEHASPTWLAGYTIAGAAPVAIQAAAWVALVGLAVVGSQEPCAGSRRRTTLIALHVLLMANPASLPALVPWLWSLAMPPLPSDPPDRDPTAALATKATSRAWPQRSVAVALACIALAAASGPWPGIPWRLGWGLAPWLEPRQLVGPLAVVSPEGTAFAFDARSAGMAAWTLPRGPRPWLEPQRALLAGRFVAEARLAADLRTGLDMQHRTADGTSGGWWVPLTGRGTRLLFIPDDDTATIRRLEPGIFKPLVIDAPIVPYALAGDPELSPAILRGLADRQIVERGAWTYTLPRSLQTDRSLDLWGLLSGRPDPRPILRQADVLLAMRLPLAALKILLPLHASGTADGAVRIAAATLDVAEQERLALGAPTAFRAAVLARLGARPAAGSPLAERLARRKQDVDSQAPIVTAYLAGGAAAAFEAITAAGGGDPWTRAMLALEAGLPDRAAEALDELRQADDPVRAATAADMLDSLHATGTSP